MQWRSVWLAALLVGLLVAGVAHGQPDARPGEPQRPDTPAEPRPPNSTAEGTPTATTEKTPTPSPAPGTIPPELTPPETPTPETTETPLQHGGGGSSVNGLLEAVSEFLRSL